MFCMPSRAVTGFEFRDLHYTKYGFVCMTEHKANAMVSNSMMLQLSVLCCEQGCKQSEQDQWSDLSICAAALIVC